MKLSGDGNKLCSAHLFATKFHIQFISRKKIIKQIENLLTPISYTGKKIAPPYTSPSFRGKTLVRGYGRSCSTFDQNQITKTVPLCVIVAAELACKIMWNVNMVV